MASWQPAQTLRAAAKKRTMNKTADSASREWFGLSRSQLIWAVAIRVLVAAVVGVIVYVVTSSVVWLIVGVFAAGVVVNAAANSRTRR
jgi:hypothetical protein